MIITPLALTTASAFTGAAAYVSWAEQPARLALDDAALLKEWQISYPKGVVLQGGLALISGLLGLAAFVVEDQWLPVVGGILMLANWPYTLLVINPTNKRLTAMKNADADPRRLVKLWGRLHLGRILLGLLGLCAFLVTEMAS
jgi:hypothetical protein